MPERKPPTRMQLETVGRWLEWIVPMPEVKDGLVWLESNSTSREVSKEIRRLYELRAARKLTLGNCYDSEIWNGFYGKDSPKYEKAKIDLENSERESPIEKLNRVREQHGLAPL